MSLTVGLTLWALLIAGSLVGVIAQTDAVRVITISVGPAGADAPGGFALTEERAIFSRIADREVIVLFQWDGVAGPHKLAATWRSPDNTASSTSAFDYVARDRRFGAFWKLNLAPTMATGMWSIDATVDGQPAGRLSFEIRDEAARGVEARRALNDAALYESLNRVFVVIERSIQNGRQVDAAAGLIGTAGRVYTAMAVIDAVDSLTAVTSTGSRHRLDSVAGLNRAQDWTILGTGPLEVPSLPIAAGSSVKVGDRCYSIEGSGASGNRVLIEGSIIGERAANRGLIGRFVTGIGTPGAPFVNEFGEVIGLVGGSGVSGATSLHDVLRFRAELKGVPIVPFSLIRELPGAQPRLLSELRDKGELTRPLIGEEHVVSGGFARQINKGPTVRPDDQREQFGVTEKVFYAFVTWSPQARLKGTAVLRLYDGENRVVMESKPLRISLGKGEMALTSWQLSPPTSPALLRAEVELDQRPIWRGFVRITP